MWVSPQKRFLEVPEIAEVKLDRANFQRLAKARIDDAKALLDNQRWDGAYYLAGYAVECGLKSCIIAKLLATDEFPEKSFSDNCWTHNLTQLVSLAGLKDKLDADADVSLNWTLVKDWNETVRYDLKGASDAKSKAEDLYHAVTDSAHGVLLWIQMHW
jgi:HEPN domain-containing protein